MNAKLQGRKISKINAFQLTELFGGVLFEKTTKSCRNPGFKGWLRGMHHHANHLQAYINEYTYRFNRNL